MVRYNWEGPAQIAAGVVPSIQAGFQAGATQGALSRFGTDPQGAINALMPINPEMAVGLQDRRDRSQRIAAEDARRVAAEQQAAMQKQLEEHRERITIGAKLIEQIQPTDEAGWQKVRASLQQYGYDVSDIPPTFDPAYVDGVRQIGRAMGQEQKPDLVVIDGVAIDKRTGQPRFESPYPRIISGPGGIYEAPRIGIGRGGTGTAPPGRVVEGSGLPPGWTVIDEDEGGAGPSGPPTFPPRIGPDY